MLSGEKLKPVIRTGALNELEGDYMTNTYPLGEIPTWMRLLQNHKRKSTLPFIIGALRDHAGLDSGGDAFEQVTDLLQSMASHPINEARQQVIDVQFCTQLGVPVVSIMSRFYNHSGCACVPSNGYGKTHLYVARSLAPSSRATLEDVADALFHGYAHPDALDLRHYSRDPDRQVWRPFDELEHEEIRSALNRAAATG